MRLCCHDVTPDHRGIRPPREKNCELAFVNLLRRSYTVQAGGIYLPELSTAPCRRALQGSVRRDWGNPLIPRTEKFQ